MQFVLFIYQGTTPLPGSAAWDAMDEAAQRAVYADYGKLNQTPGLTAGPPLGLPADATTVRVHEGALVSAAGPYAGAAHAVGGYLVLEADDLDAAKAVAATIPAARLGGAIEIRPSATYW